LSEVRTLHSFGRSTLSRLLKNKIKIYSKLSKVIQDDNRIINGTTLDFDKIFSNRDDLNENLVFYEKRRKYYDCYGFTDVIFAAVNLLESNKDEVPNFELVLIDEFQDFNKLEVSLIDLLAEKNPILIVGDDDQALYESLKSASSTHIRERYANRAHNFVSFTLPYCARCPQVVVESANDIIKAAKVNGYLKGRIEKPFEYLKTEDKDIISVCP
jgi:superfamily I DNA/RNA helicase